MGNCCSGRAARDAQVDSPEAKSQAKSLARWLQLLQMLEEEQPQLWDLSPGRLPLKMQLREEEHYLQLRERLWSSSRVQRVDLQGCCASPRAVALIAQVLTVCMPASLLHLVSRFRSLCCPFQPDLFSC